VSLDLDCLPYCALVPELDWCDELGRRLGLGWLKLKDLYPLSCYHKLINTLDGFKSLIGQNPVTFWSVNGGIKTGIGK
jgi:hypothetical protein